MSTIPKSKLHNSIIRAVIRRGMALARPTLRSRRLFAVGVLAFAVRCSAQHHLENNHAEPNAANDRQPLLGNWFGRRQRLADRGVTSDLWQTVHI